MEREEEENGTPDVESQSCKHVCEGEGVCSTQHNRQKGTVWPVAVAKTQADSPHARACSDYT